MKYDSFNGIYKWARKDTYICQICSEEVRSYRRMRHIGQHMVDLDLGNYERYLEENETYWTAYP